MTGDNVMTCPLPGTWPQEPELAVAGDRYLQRRGFKSGPSTQHHSRFQPSPAPGKWAVGQREEKLAT